MSASSNCIENYIAAAFAYEFMDGGVDYDSLTRLHRGDVRDWVAAVAASGLFTNAQVQRVEADWRREPRSLLDALLSEADEMAVRRCEQAWAALDHSGDYADAMVARREPVAVG